MTKKSLNDHLVTYYKNKRLSPLLRQDLLAVMEENDKKGVGKEPRSFHLWPAAEAFFKARRFAYASLLLALGIVVWMVSGIPGNNAFRQELTVAVSNEIGMNHTKRFKVEFEDQTITGLIKQMDKLDFTLRMPARLSQSLTITGARYCSIRGRIAAQVHMTDSNGHYYTLYQTKLVDPLAAIEETSLHLDGVGYRLWHEDGVFFGFAGPPDFTF
ncbi:MAG: hypothetical protein WBB19_00425 [Desulforhopalus sp.]